MSDRTPPTTGKTGGQHGTPVITVAHKPFGATGSTAGSDTSTTEWFATRQERATWLNQAGKPAMETSLLVRLTDDDEHGAVLGDEHEVVCLHDLADRSREEARQAGLLHAAARHRIVAVVLCATWPTAATIVADLAAALTGEGNPFIEEIRDATGKALWTQEICAEPVDRAEEQLSIALDFTHPEAAGWVPLTAAQLANWAGTTGEMGEYYTLDLPGVTTVAEATSATDLARQPPNPSQFPISSTCRIQG